MSLFTKKEKRVDWGDEYEVTVPNVPAIAGVALAALVAIIVLVGCVAVVGTGQTAVVTRFGNVVGTEGQGIHLKLPVDRYNMIDVTQQQVTAEYSTATKDNQSLTQEITAQVVVKPDMAESLSEENFQKLFYEKWDGKLPTYMGGDGGLDMLLPQPQAQQEKQQ